MYWSRKSVGTPLEAWGPPWTTSTMTDLPPKMRGVRKTKNMSCTKTQASRTVATFRLGRRMTDRNDMHMHMPVCQPEKNHFLLFSDLDALADGVVVNLRFKISGTVTGSMNRKIW